jgi:hypothetical protein
MRDEDKIMFILEDYWVKKKKTMVQIHNKNNRPKMRIF